jgi:hypothetical protein
VAGKFSEGIFDANLLHQGKLDLAAGMNFTFLKRMIHPAVGALRPPHPNPA